MPSPTGWCTASRHDADDFGADDDTAFATPLSHGHDGDVTRPAAERWRDELSAWAIPPDILAAAPEPPWGFPVELFRADAESPDTPSRDAALAALPDGGTVLDVGCGGGGASLALVPPAAL